MEKLDELLAKHPFFAGLSSDWVTLIAQCGKQHHFKAGVYLFREGEDADAFYIIRRGSVALEVYTPGQGPLLIQTEAENEVLGWSWLFPPYKWELDARTQTEVTAIVLDGKCLRGKCDANPSLGYDLMKRFAAIAVERLHATRLRLTDMYSALRSGPKP